VLGVGALGALIVLLLGRGAGDTFWGVAALAAGLALGAAGLGAPRRGPENVSLARVLTWAAPLTALLLIGLATFLRAVSELLAASPSINAYARAERLASLYAGGQRLLQLTLIAVGVHLVAVVVAAVRRPEGRLLQLRSLGTGVLLVLVACLPLATTTRRVRDVVLGVDQVNQRALRPGVMLPVRHHAGDPPGGPMLVLGNDDSFIEADLPPKGVKVVSLAIDARRPFASVSRYLQRLLDNGVERVRPVFAYQPNESLAVPPHPFWGATFLAPLVPPTVATLERGCTVVLRRVNPGDGTVPAAAAAPPAPDGKPRKEQLYTPPAGEPWKRVAKRLGQLELTACRGGADPVLGF
jgi:hypothetical protein